MQASKTTTKPLISAATVLILCGLAGCRGGYDGPQRYDVEGAVTMNGKPAPSGEIAFYPDAEKQNTGPGTLTRIENGHYKTTRGKGASVGPHSVRIIIYDGVPNGESANGNVLTTKPFMSAVDIPANSSVHNFDVPASHLVK